MRNKFSAAEKETHLPINQLTSYLRRVNYISDKRIERINFSIPLAAKGREEKINKENSLPRNPKTLKRNFTIRNGKMKEKEGNYYHNFFKEIKNLNEQTVQGNEERKYNYLKLVYSNGESQKKSNGSEMNVIFLKFNAIGCINENRKIMINKGCAQFLEGLKEIYKIFIVIDDDFSIIKLIICELFKINFYFDRIYTIERLPLCRNKNKLFLDYAFHIDKNSTKKIEKINNFIIFTTISSAIFETLSKTEKDLSSSEISNFILNTENLVPYTDFEVKEKHFWLLSDFEQNTKLDDYQPILQIKNLKNLESSANEINLNCFYELISRKIKNDSKNEFIFSSLSILKRKSMNKNTSKKNSQTVMGAKTELKKNLFEFILNFKKENKLKNLLVGPTLEQYFESNSFALNTYLRNEINEGEKIQKVLNLYAKLKENSEIQKEEEEAVTDMQLNKNKLFMLKK